MQAENSRLEGEVDITHTCLWPLMVHFTGNTFCMDAGCVFKACGLTFVVRALGPSPVTYPLEPVVLVCVVNSTFIGLHALHVVC